MRIGARHHRLAALDRLAQGIEHLALKLRQFIQKQHAEMGEADFAWLYLQPAADQRRHRGGVMGAAERAAA